LSLIKRGIILVTFIGVVFGQIQTSVAEFRPFSDKLSYLRFQPSSFQWSIGNHFILLDHARRELVEVDALGDVSLSSGIQGLQGGFGDITWMGVSPQGLQAIDRLNNELVLLDFKLNPIDVVSLTPRIYPELGAIDAWGRLFLYSKTYNCIYLVENSELQSHPFLDFSREFGQTVCLEKMAINDAGEIGLLDCDGTVILLSPVGRVLWTMPPDSIIPEYLVPVRDHWIVFNQNGEGQSLTTRESINIPGASLPFIDIQSMNRSIAILSKDHILILDVQ